jgi:hypothetical protein
MVDTQEFSLFLFSTDPRIIRIAVRSGVRAIIVDLERLGKEQRQAGSDTDISTHTIADLRRVRSVTAATVICRINGFHPGTREEIEQVVDAGADELLLPMVRSPAEVESVIEMVRDRAGVGILIETTQAVYRAPTLAKLPLTRVYVGLNDLAIERRTPSIFTALVDGTVEELRGCIVDQPFGFGGLTVPEGGWPIPCRLLIAEMARLRCHFAFLRRSFHRDVRSRDIEVEIPRLLEAIADAARRPSDEIAMDQAALQAAVLAATGSGSGIGTSMASA